LGRNENYVELRAQMRPFPARDDTQRRQNRFVF
jgi:hypothetical protein